MGEKVKFILRPAAVSQTKFPSVKISCWDFSTYSKKKTKQKKSYRSVFTFSKKPLTRMKPWTWCEWNCNDDTVLYLSNSLRNKNMKQTMETIHKSDEVPTPTVMGLYTN